MFFNIGNLKNFAIFAQKHLCWGVFLIKLQAIKTATFLKRDSITADSCGYWEIFKNNFFCRTPLMVASENSTTAQ